MHTRAYFDIYIFTVIIMQLFNDTQNTQQFWSAQRQTVNLEILWSSIYACTTGKNFTFLRGKPERLWRRDLPLNTHKTTWFSLNVTRTCKS